MVVCLFGSALAGWASTITLFTDLDTYLQRGKDILIAQAVALPADGQAGVDDLHLVEVDALRTLKGTNQPGLLTIATIYPMSIGRRYLLYSLGGSFRRTSFLAVDELSVVEVPSWFDLGQLDGKSPRAQIALLFELRLAEIKRRLKELEHDKQLLEKAAGAGTNKAPASFRETDSDAPKEAAPPAARPGSPASFGPVIERTLGQLELLDLDTGQKAAPIAQGEPKQQPHLDVYLDFGADAQNRSFPMLVSQFLYTVRATNWDVSADELEAVLRTNATPPRVRVLAKPQDSLPVTYWFRTRVGNLGVLQVLGFKQDPPEEVRIRYRLIKTKQ